jgi:hypothetical protein
MSQPDPPSEANAVIEITVYDLLKGSGLVTDEEQESALLEYRKRMVSTIVMQVNPCLHPFLDGLR